MWGYRYRVIRAAVPHSPPGLYHGIAWRARLDDAVGFAGLYHSAALRYGGFEPDASSSAAGCETLHLVVDCAGCCGDAGSQQVVLCTGRAGAVDSHGHFKPVVQIDLRNGNTVSEKSDNQILR